MSSHHHHNHHRHSEEDAAGIKEMFAGYESAELNATLEAERDVLGTRTGLRHRSPPDEGVLQTALEGFQQALEDLPAERKEAYTQAMQYNPQIVQVETPPERFLLATENDYWAAAARLADYWSKRKEVFGPKRFVLPLRISVEEESAFSKEAQNAIKSMACIVLPPDQFQRPVLLLDRERINCPFSNVATRLQYFFFVLHLLSESDDAVLNGFVNIVTMEMTKTEYTEKFKPTVGGFRLVYSEVIPVRMKAAHYVALKEPTFLQKSVNAWCTLFQKWKFLELRSRIHYVEKVDEALQQLRAYGFSEHHLPKQFLGTVQPEKWYHDRVALERERYVFLQSDGPSDDIVQAADDDSKLPANDTDRQSTLKRKMEEVHEHNKIQMKKLKVSKLKSRQAALLDEQRMLEAQWTCTQFLFKRYRTEKTQIWNLLQNMLESPIRITSAVSTLTPAMVERCRDGRPLDPHLLTAYEYNGRNLLTGQLMFQRIHIDSVSTEERAIVEHILLCLPDLLAASSADTEMSTIEAESDDSTLELQLDAWQSQLSQLKQANERLKDEEEFLRAADEWAQCLEEQFLEFKERQLISLSELVAQVLCEQTGLPLSALQGQHHPQVVAEYLLSKSLWFPGLPSHGLTKDLLEMTLWQEGYLVPRADLGDPSSAVIASEEAPDNAQEGLTGDLTIASSTCNSIGVKKKEGVEERRQRVQKRRKASLKRL